MDAQKHCVFVTGGTGYVGRPLITRLLKRGHEVRALVRPGSEAKLPPGCQAVFGDALDGSSYAAHIRPSNTFVQLVGVAHPNPRKAAEFRSIDLASGRGAIEAASAAGVQHFVYVSVAHPAPVMKDYIHVRSECEAMIRQSGMNATILRPWYVLGPGHRWPYLLLPVYKIMEWLPSTRPGAIRLGLVTLEQMCQALVHAVETPTQGVRVVEVAQIRDPGGFFPSAAA
ncbi:MAG: NAD(P)H-binding protein [Terriglobales bacterium]